MIRQYGRILFLLIIGIALVILALNCNSSGVADSGGGIDIGNPTKISVVDSLNRPVANASVKLIASDTWLPDLFNGRGVVYDSGITDKSGTVRIYSLAAGNYNLQIDHPSGGVLIRDFYAQLSHTAGQIRIKQYGSISGTISGTTGTPVQIHFAGTTFNAPVDADGSYTLNIAEGLCFPLFMSADSQWTPGNTINVITSKASVSNEAVSFTTLLIDDFEDSASTMRLSRFVGSSHLYVAHYEIDSALARYEIVPEGFEGGRALKGTLINQGAWALVGYYLGVKSADDSLWDFSSATGLSFYAKGRGTLNISFESDSIDRMDSYKHYSADIKLQAQWTLFTISFDTLTFKKDSNSNPDITWKESAQSIKRIEFNSLDEDTTEFLLDDLKINGVDFSSVY